MGIDKDPTGIKTSTQFIPLESARWRLALLWFPGCGLIFLILIAQSLFGAYGDEVQRAWGWALPNFLPTLALMVSVFAASALRPIAESDAVVRRSFVFLAVSLSAFYIAVLLLSIVGQIIFMSYNTGDPDPISRRLALLEMSNYWLAPLQSLVVAAIGVLFFLKEKEEPAAEAAGGQDG